MFYINNAYTTIVKLTEGAISRILTYFLFSGNLTALKWYPILLVCAVFCSGINNVDKIEISCNSVHLEFQYV